MNPKRAFPTAAVALALTLSLIDPGAGTLAAQQASGAADSLRLGSLQRDAVSSDPRQRQFELLERQTALRLRNLSAEWFPSLSAVAKAQYQSDVFAAPAGAAGPGLPSPSKDTYDGHLEVEQTLFDPTLGPRRRVEQAELAGSEAELRTALFGLRQEVNEAFFGAALLSEQARLIAASTAELEQQLAESRIRVREGAALPSDTAAIMATLLERRQDQTEVANRRHAALVRLAELIKRPVADSAAFALPELTALAAEARRALDSLRVRPEYAQFARSRELLSERRSALSADRRPRLSAFGQAGYGRPGLNPVSRSFDSYFLAGVEVKWAPWNWGSTGRERQALALQQQVVATEEAAFTSRLTRDIQNDLADMDRLDSAITLDDQIVSLRDRVESETRIRFREGTVTASEFVDRSTDALEARLARASHRVEQVQARARFLTTLGLEIR